MSNKSDKLIRRGIALLLLFVGLVACAPAKELSNQPEQASVTILPSASLVLSEKYALFVQMNDRYSGGLGGRPGWQVSRNQHRFFQRVYKFDQGEPITVTATVLVFDAGELGVTNCNFREYQAQVTTLKGQEVPLTLEGQVTLHSSDSRQCVVGIGVDQYTPYEQTFKIDKWFDLSAGGDFTLTLKRKVFNGNEGFFLEGNPVRIRVGPH